MEKTTLVGQPARPAEGITNQQPAQPANRDSAYGKDVKGNLWSFVKH